MRQESISVVIPAYNEQKNIQCLVDKVFNFLKNNFEDFEIIIVDDGSCDDTYQICQQIKNKLGDSLRILKHQTNKGYGAALRTGLFSAEKQLIFYTDADNQFDIQELIKFVEAIEDVDYVIGYRKNRQDPVIRKFTARCYNYLIRFLFGLKVKDIDCSFKLFKRECLFSLSIERDNFFIDTELLLKAMFSGFKLKQIGVNHFSRKSGKSTVRLFHVFTTLSDVCYMRRRLGGGKG